MKRLVYIFALCLLFSCENPQRKNIIHVVSEWQNREIFFPKDMSFVSYSRKFGEQKVYLQKGKYTVLSYIDSTGCMSCKLRLPEWREFMNTVDSVSHGTIPFIFAFQSNAKDDLIHSLKKSGFDYPVYIDENCSFNRLNKFPTDMQLQTFLLDSDNKVIAIGNPIYNSKVKELYLNIILGKNDVISAGEDGIIQTRVNVDRNSIPLGDFNWQKEQKATFILKNIGDNLLVIEDVNTSCGCTSVSYSKELVQPGKEIALEVSYKADHPEHFNKTITVYCNAESSPVTLKISGDAE